MSLPRAVAWWLAPDAPDLPDEARLEGELDPEDRARLARRRRPEARRALLVSRGLLRRAVAAWLDVAPERVALAGGGHAPLRVAAPDASLHVSVSHTRGLVACAVGERAVGVDVEPADRAVRALALARRFFAEEEAAALEALEEAERTEAFLRLWVAKEAALKASGRGLAGGLAVMRAGEGAAPGRTMQMGARRLALEVTRLPAGLLGLAIDAREANLSVRPGLPLVAPVAPPLGASQARAGRSRP